MFHSFFHGKSKGKLRYLSNYENIYPEDITKYIDPISWKAHFGESYFITITGGKTNGDKAVYEDG